MKSTRLAVIVLLIALCGFSWLKLGRDVTGAASELRGLEQQASDYRQQGLYALAIGSYQQLLAQKPSGAAYDALIEACEAYYAEEHTTSVRNTLLSAYGGAAAAYPEQTAYWEGYARVYLDAGSYTDAASVLRRAADAHAASETLSGQWRQAYYSFRTLYAAYEQVAPREAGGVYPVGSGGLFGTVDAECSPVREMLYRYVGPVGEDGAVLCVTQEGEVQLFDADGRMFGRFSAPVEEAMGYGCGRIPVRLEGRSDWCYLDTGGNEVCGGFLRAGMFQNDTAAAQLESGAWCLIGPDGAQKSKGSWQEVRLDASGRYQQEGTVLLKTDGLWRLYSASGSQKGDFSCEEIDACYGGPIAFCQGGRWGFVDAEGAVVLEPRYEAARSFSGGVAAVGDGGVWNFIDPDGALVVQGDFADVGYFSPDSGSCPVMPDGDAGEWRLIAWRVPR